MPGHTGGESETIIGRWIARRGRHDDVVIATKVGSDMGLGYKCLRKDYIMQAVEDSLRRLQVDAIDLYQSHWDDEKTSFDETLDAYARLIEQGKVKAIGASNLTAQRLAEALEASKRMAYPRYETLQPLYNLYDRGAFEGTLAEVVRARADRRHHVFLARCRLPHRQVSRRKRTSRRARADAGMKKYLNPRGLRILAALDAGRGATRCDAGAGGARLAHRPTGRHRTDRERHVARAAR